MNENVQALLNKLNEDGFLVMPCSSESQVMKYGSFITECRLSCQISGLTSGSSQMPTSQNAFKKHRQTSCSNVQDKPQKARRK